MRALLDVNLLLALFDPAHTHHARSVSWWQGQASGGWASCPLTQNGFVRVVSRASYPRPARLPDALQLLRAWAVPPRHEFWPDDLSLLDETYIDHSRLLGPNQITDIYLLALAVKNGGRLVTFDRGVTIAAVKGAKAKNLVVL